MKRAKKQTQNRAHSRGEGNQRVKSVRRRRLLMEGLEPRQLLAGDWLLCGHDHHHDHDHDDDHHAGHVHGHDHGDLAAAFAGWSGYSAPVGSAGDDVGTRSTTLARNIGTVNAYRITESEPNDFFHTAQLLPLGTRPQDQHTIDVSGRLSIADAPSRTPADIDIYAVDLRAGDILDIATIGAVGNVDVFYAPNQLWFGGEVDASGAGTTYPYASPLQTSGDITIAQVAPVTGRYYIRLAAAPVGGVYTMGLRVYRPVMEQAPVGQKQILFIDFDGASYTADEFGPLVPGVARLTPMSEFLPEWGLLQPGDENRIIDRVLAVVEENFRDIGLIGNNGFFDLTGRPGDFSIEIRNSRDHVDDYGSNPYVSRVIVGGTQVESGVETIGLAASIDPGNFDTSETGFVLLDSIADLILPIEFTASYSVVDTISTFLGNVVTHEAGHFFGGWHQNNANALVSIMDQGGDIPGFTGTGPDGIYGTADDFDVDFTNDFFTPNEGIAFGRQDTVNAMAFGLSTGTAGGTITGFVFSDTNRNGTRGSGEAGVAGVTVFADLNANGIQDVTEPSTVTDASGAYTLLVAPGSVRVTMLPPLGYVTTNDASQVVNVSLNGSASASFGVLQVQQNITGYKWNDINGNGVRDPGEPGIEGVYIYLDIDGDDRLDLGEPRTQTNANGEYQLNFPGTGTYTIREVVEAGFIQTYPPTGEYVVTYTGVPVVDKNFGNRSVVDYGDAPAPYPTLAADNGAAHGIINGLSLGTPPDSEADGQPSPGALGDDNNGIDDEDGVTVLSPIAPGGEAVLSFDVRNTTGSAAYLSGWIDINGDGQWSAEERFISDVVVNGTQTITRQFTVPNNAQLGETYARFRLSTTPNVGPTGFTAGGEVEDYAVNITASPDLANDDTFVVPRGAVNFPLDVFANDFDPDFNPLVLVDIDDSNTRGQVFFSPQQRVMLYTPSGLGTDSFTYTVRNQDGSIIDSATVDIQVTFQSEVPIAVDDSFNIPQGSVNQPLNVLGNDIPSVAGGMRIIATSATSAGGTVTITSGGQSVRYTPAVGFAGTDQFTYTVTDAVGQISTAVATVHMQPGSTADDLAGFIVETFANDGVTPISTVAAGQRFKVRVSVDDLRDLSTIDGAGLGSAYLDLLYTDGLVSTVDPTGASSGFPFDITFGSLFSTVRTGSATTPGIFNEVGATQASPGTPFGGRAELFTITLEAVNPGIVEFIADPADAPVSDVVLLNDPSAELTPSQIRFGRSQLTIVPSGADFVYAVDDIYSIPAGQTAVLDVTQNDNLGSTGEVEIVAVSGSTAGVTPTVNANGNIVYTPRTGFSGVDQFTYTILSEDGIQSTAEVTVTVGNADANDLVEFDFTVLDLAGNPVDQLTVGQRFQLQIMVDDLRMFGEAAGVFAAYMDILYDKELAQPTNTTGNPLGFDVEFGPTFDFGPAVGDAFVPGLINEFGTIDLSDGGGGTPPMQSEPVLFATIQMIALAPGSLRIAADPADVSPAQDVLMYDLGNPVPVDRIRFDELNIPVVGGGSGEGESPYQNRGNRMDVNGDSVISPIDALLILNRLNRGVSGEGEASATSDGGTPSVFWDVNGDKRLSPIDALQVINFLNRRRPGAGGEGEAAPPVTPTSTVDADANGAKSYAATADSFFSDLGRQSLLTGGSQGGSDSAPTPSTSFATPSVADEDDDDSDELFGLLAGE